MLNWNSNREFDLASISNFKAPGLEILKGNCSKLSFITDVMLPCGSLNQIPTSACFICCLNATWCVWLIVWRILNFDPIVPFKKPAYLKSFPNQFYFSHQPYSWVWNPISSCVFHERFFSLIIYFFCFLISLKVVNLLDKWRKSLTFSFPYLELIILTLMP